MSRTYASLSRIKLLCSLGLPRAQTSYTMVKEQLPQLTPDARHATHQRPPQHILTELEQSTRLAVPALRRPGRQS